MKTSKSLRLMDETIKYIEDYPSVYRGGVDFTTKVEEIIRFSQSLIELTKLELSEYFETKECCLIIDVLNGHLHSTNISPKESLYLNISDGNFYEGLADKWELDIDVLLEKIKKLTQFQAHVVFIMSNEFWELDDEFRNRNNFTDIVKQIFKSKN